MNILASLFNRESRARLSLLDRGRQTRLSLLNRERQALLSLLDRERRAQLSLLDRGRREFFLGQNLFLPLIIRDLKTRPQMVKEFKNYDHLNI